MTAGSAPCAVGLAELPDDLFHEVGSERAEALEVNLLACGACADRIASLEQLRTAVAGAARRAEVAASKDSRAGPRSRPGSVAGWGGRSSDPAPGCGFS